MPRRCYYCGRPDPSTVWPSARGPVWACADRVACDARMRADVARALNEHAPAGSGEGQ